MTQDTRQQQITAAAATERATLSLCNQINPEVTRKMLAANATGDQIVVALAALASHSPKPAPSPAPQIRLAQARILANRFLLSVRHIQERPNSIERMPRANASRSI